MGATGKGRSPKFNGRRQPSIDGTSRMMREYQVRICERLGVKFPGPTRQTRKWRAIRGESALTRWSQPVDATLYLRGKRWSVGWNEDFIEVLLRQRRRSYGIAGSAGSR